MLSRRNWITEFIGHVLREGMADDPDRVFDSASELYWDWSDLDPELAADSTFSADDLRPVERRCNGAGATRS